MPYKNPPKTTRFHIVKAFATAWRYREMYEECGDVDTIAKS